MCYTEWVYNKDQAVYNKTRFKDVSCAHQKRPRKSHLKFCSPYQSWITNFLSYGLVMLYHGIFQIISCISTPPPPPTPHCLDKIRLDLYNIPWYYAIDRSKVWLVQLLRKFLTVIAAVFARPAFPYFRRRCRWIIGPNDQFIAQNKLLFP